MSLAEVISFKVGIDLNTLYSQNDVAIWPGIDVTMKPTHVI